MARHPASRPLTDRQADILKFVRRYHTLTGGACPASVIAKTLKMHHETVRDHFDALYRKGWLISRTSPATARRPYLARR